MCLAAMLQVFAYFVVKKGEMTWLSVPVGICRSRAGVPGLLRVVVCHTMTVCCPKDLGLCVNQKKKLTKAACSEDALLIYVI